jgi:hypothetical protein
MWKQLLWTLVRWVTLGNVLLDPSAPANIEKEKNRITEDLKTCAEALKDIHKAQATNHAEIDRLKGEIKESVRSGREVERKLVAALRQARKHQRQLDRRERVYEKKVEVLQDRLDNLVLHVDAHMPDPGKSARMASERLPKQLEDLNVHRDVALIDGENVGAIFEEGSDDDLDEIEQSIRAEVAAEESAKLRAQSSVQPSVVNEIAHADEIARLAQARMHDSDPEVVDDDELDEPEAA